MVFSACTFLRVAFDLKRLMIPGTGGALLVGKPFNSGKQQTAFLDRGVFVQASYMFKTGFVPK